MLKTLKRNYEENIDLICLNMSILGWKMEFGGLELKIKIKKNKDI